MSVILSPSQQTTVDAFRAFLLDPEDTEFLVSGFAGSGKSFLVEYLVNVVEREHKVARIIDPKALMHTFHFAATTNKAANVLSARLNKPAGTIHRLLGLSPQPNYKTGTSDLVRKYDSKNLSYSIVFIDEASMITRELLKYIRSDADQFIQCKVVYIGDSYQLPPIKEAFCPIFHTNMPMHFLTEIQRQVAGSPIIQLASQYRAMLDDHKLEWPEIIPDNQSIFHYTDKYAWFNAVEKSYLPVHDADDVKVLAWSNDRVREYNTWIRSFSGQTGDFAVNETVQTNKPIQRNNRVIASTDSVHIIRNIRETVIDDIEGYIIDLEAISTGIVMPVFQPKDWKEANQLAASYAKQAKQTKVELYRRKFWKVLRRGGDLPYRPCR